MAASDLVGLSSMAALLLPAGSPDLGDDFSLSGSPSDITRAVTASAPSVSKTFPDYPETEPIAASKVMLSFIFRYAGIFAVWNDTIAFSLCSKCGTPHERGPSPCYLPSMDDYIPAQLRGARCVLARPCGGKRVISTSWLSPAASIIAIHQSAGSTRNIVKP